MRDGFIGPHVRIPSGVGGLDEMLAGGLLPGRPYLVVGPPGSGKTTLALQFLLQGAKRGEDVLYVTLEEPPNELKEDFKGFPEAIKNIWVFDAIPDVMRYEKAPFKDIAAVRAAKRLTEIPKGVRQTDEFRSVEIAFSALMQTLKMETAKRFYTRVVVDSLTALKYFCMKGFDDATGAQVFLRFIAEMKITALLLVESPEDDAQLPERMLARGEIHLYNWESDRRLIRAIGIEKFRGSPHDNNLHPYRIASHGIAVDTTVSISKETREILPLPPSTESFAAKPSETELVLEAEWALMALLDDVRELLDQGIDAEPVRELVQQAHAELSEMRVQEALALLLEAREKVNHLILVNQVSEEYLQKYAASPRVRQTSLGKSDLPVTQLDPKIREEARLSLNPLLDRLQNMLTTPQGKAMAENLTPSLLERAREKIQAANASKISPVASVEDATARPPPSIPSPSRPAAGPMPATRIGEAPGGGAQRPTGTVASTALERGSKGTEGVAKPPSSPAPQRPDAPRTPSQVVSPISSPPEEVRKVPTPPVPSAAPLKPSVGPVSGMAAPRNPSQGNSPSVARPKVEALPQPARPAFPDVTAPPLPAASKPVPGELPSQGRPSTTAPTPPLSREGPSWPRVETTRVPDRTTPPSVAPKPSLSSPPPMVRPGPAPTLVRRDDAAISQQEGRVTPPSGPVHDMGGTQERKETLTLPSVPTPIPATTLTGVQAPAAKPEPLRTTEEPQAAKPVEPVTVESHRITQADTSVPVETKTESAREGEPTTDRETGERPSGEPPVLSSLPGRTEIPVTSSQSPHPGPAVETPPEVKPTPRKGTRAPSKPHTKRIVTTPSGEETPAGTGLHASEVPPPARKRASSKTAEGTPRAPRKPSAHPRKSHPKQPETAEAPHKGAEATDSPPPVTENTSGGDPHETA